MQFLGLTYPVLVSILFPKLLYPRSKSVSVRGIVISLYIYFTQREREVIIEGTTGCGDTLRE
jgi:hypothetical protein